MSLVNHKGSKYLYYAFQLNGRKYFKSTKTTNKALARQIEARAYEQAVKEQTLGRDLEQITFGEALTGYIQSKEGTPFHRQLMTIVAPLKGYKRDHRSKKMVKVHGLDFSTPVHHVKTADLNRLVEARRREGSADATIKQHLVAVSGALKWAKSMGYMVDDATTIPQIKLARTQPVFMTAAEEQRLLDSLDPTAPREGYGTFESRPPHRQQRLQDQFDFVLCLLDTGGRYHEVTHLAWKDVDLDNGLMFVRQHKTGKAHTIVMTDRVKKVLASRASNKTHVQWVFPNDARDDHRPYHSAWLTRAVKRAGIDKKIRFHKLRSTFASKLVQRGVSLFEVQQLLGHSSPQTTMVYASLVPSDVSKKASLVLNEISNGSR